MPPYNVGRMALRPAPGLRALAPAAAKVTGPAFRRRGFMVAEILMRWPAIVGETLAQATCPERLTFPTGKADGASLKLRVAPGFGPEVQHLEPLIVERLNGYFGYRAVERLRLVQGPLPLRRQAPAPKPRPLDPAEEARLQGLLDGIADKGLREALARLGRSLLAAGGAART